MEIPSVAFERFEILKSHKRIKEESIFKFVFLDETWILQIGTLSRSWQNQNKWSAKSIKTEGRIYIVLHARNADGFIEDSLIEGAELIFSFNTLNPDYHGETNEGNFLKWFGNQL